ncbi:MAG: hypothetical protein KAT70_06280 [Thermoplasmata archaeon]|nr:hypothetical protein [Thermoplasmata archaeon]
MRVVVDSREFNSSVVKELSRKGLIIESKRLEVGDYVLSSTLAVERKEVGDFLASLMDGRLFSQMSSLSRAYLEPILIIEGTGLMTRKNLAPQAIYGALASISTDFRIPVFSTENSAETAEFIHALARRKERGRRTNAPARRHGKPGPSNTREAQLFIVEGLPGVSAVAARRLLGHFGTVMGVLTASEKELMGVQGIGKKTAANIVLVSRSEYR